MDFKLAFMDPDVSGMKKIRKEISAILLNGGKNHLLRALIKFRNEVNDTFSMNVAHITVPFHENGARLASNNFDDF